jgi:hypothetical protein
MEANMDKKGEHNARELFGIGPNVQMAIEAHSKALREGKLFGAQRAASIRFLRQHGVEVPDMTNERIQAHREIKSPWDQLVSGHLVEPAPTPEYVRISRSTECAEIPPAKDREER